ncbi:MAG: amidohydrolase family protein [Robiginitalea sp.]
MKNVLTGLLSILFFASCQNSGGQVDLLITNASIVDMETGSVAQDRLVGINQDTIAVIDRMGAEQTYTARKRIDAQGQYILPGLWDNHSLALGRKEEVSNALDSLESLEVDYVKTYDGSLSPEVYYEIIRQAEARGLKVTGHMPLSADIRKAMELGLDGVEHLYYFLPASSSVGDSLRSLNQGYGALVPLINTYDEALAGKVMQEAAINGLFATPTLHIGKVLEELHIRDHSQDTLLNYIGPGVIGTYQGREVSAKNRTPEAQEFYSKMETIFGEMLKPAFDSGINLLAGSDCGPFNSYVYPGASLHSELEAMVKVGMSPLEALRSSVVNGPAFFGLEKHYGNVAVGRAADLILLRENPLARIEHSRSISTVIRGTAIYDQNKIEEFLRSLKKRYQATQEN